MALALGLLFALPAQSATVITTPPTFDDSYSGGSGADTIGGTFTAGDSKLGSFSLFLGAVGGGSSNQVQAVVLETSGGAPTGVPVWSSAPFEAVGTPIEFVFNPDITLSLGAQYFIGVDTGIYNTGLAGGDITVQYAPNWSGDTNPGGDYWVNSNGAPGAFSMNGGRDIATTITMIANPEPNTFMLVSLGLVGLGAMRKRHGGGQPG